MISFLLGCVFVLVMLKWGKDIWAGMKTGWKAVPEYNDFCACARTAIPLTVVKQRSALDQEIYGTPTTTPFTGSSVCSVCGKS